jgi:PAS domain S-box-containing protein
MSMSSTQRGEQFAGSRALQRAEYAVALILAKTDDPVEVYAGVLDAIGSSLGWELGAVWEMHPGDRSLHCVQTWHAGEGAAEFEALSEHITLAPGEGLPGRVLELHEPVWLVDAPRDANFPRASAARRSGLHAAFGFPLDSPRGVVGVMEFFSRKLREPDERLLQTMRVLGSLVGQFVVRRRAEDEVRARESRLRAMLESALDGVVSMNDHGRVIGWNRAAELTFGYSEPEAIGHDMADLIIPPALRARHRRGLVRFLETHEPVVLDQRLELTGLHKNGTEFPVELTITRVALPGPPTFTGYLRDITDRKRVEHELRASRARLVEVADMERRRIQRNLHDGAQQQLTAVLLNLGLLRESPEDLDALLGEAIDQLAAGLQEVRELASGLHPALLSERGLAVALRGLVLRTPLPLEIEAVPAEGLPKQVEAAAYYVVAEALANAQKHASASKVVVRAGTESGNLVVEVVDDGRGGADAQGSGLRGLADRVDALGGRLTVESRPGGGTRLRAEIPAH